MHFALCQLIALTFYATYMKTLRLTFAMGGGVSLGSFSGAALTEILKAFILYGQDKEGNPYDRIVLDSMSGASAGAIALAILLRTLLDYESIVERICERYAISPKRKGEYYFPIEKKEKEEVKQEKDIFIKIIETEVDKLEDKYKERLRNELSDTNLLNQHWIRTREQLIAVEVSQILQEILWVHEVNIDELFDGDKTKSKDKKYNQKENSVSLLSREKLISLVAQYLMPQDEDNLNKKKKEDSILGERILYACSLTNLLPREMEEEIISGIEINNYPLVRETQNALKSKTHKELRVFDFDFSNGTMGETIENWIRIVDGINANSMTFPIDSKKTWAKISATAIACGAFPIAFEPVILKRYKSEFIYGKSKNSEGKNDKKTECHNNDNNTSKCDKKENNGAIKAHNYTSIWDFKSVEEHKVPYVDGGTFNNEPIREAFKMANFIDTNLYYEENQKEFDRLVVYVDPIVDTKEVNYNMTAFDSHIAALNKNTGTINRIVKNNDINKAISLTQGLLGMLRNQGSVKEEHKINNYISNVRLKRELKQYINEVPLLGVEVDLFKNIINRVEKNLKKGIIPYGTRKIEKYLYWKLKNQIRDNDEYGDDFNQDLADKIIEGIKADKTLKEMEIDERFLEPIKKAFFNMIIDAALDIDGKDPNAVRFAVTPVSYVSNNGNQNVKAISLPGTEIQAFGGFASLAARKYAFEYGKYCTLMALKRTDFRAYYEELKLQNLINTNPKPFVLQNGVDQALGVLRKDLSDEKITPPSTFVDLKNKYIGNIINKLDSRIDDFISKAKSRISSLVTCAGGVCSSLNKNGFKLLRDVKKPRAPLWIGGVMVILFFLLLFYNVFNRNAGYMSMLFFIAVPIYFFYALRAPIKNIIKKHNTIYAFFIRTRVCSYIIRLSLFLF